MSKNKIRDILKMASCDDYEITLWKIGGATTCKVEVEYFDNEERFLNSESFSFKGKGSYDRANEKFEELKNG